MRYWLSLLLLCASANANPPKKIKVKKVTENIQPQLLPSEQTAKRIAAAIEHRDKKALKAELGLPLRYEGLISDGCRLSREGVVGDPFALDTFADCLLRVYLINEAKVVLHRESFEGGSIAPFEIVIDTDDTLKVVTMKIPHAEGQKAGVVGGPIR